MGNKAEDVIRMEGHTRSYIRQYAVHDPAVIKKPELLDGSQYFKFHFIGTNITGLSTSKFLDDLMNYEADHQIKGNRKKRYGKMFDILMPKGSWDDETLLKIAKAFWKRLVQKESGLKFIAWKFYSGQPRKEKRPVTMIRIWIADRERYYTQHVVKPLHKRTAYMAAGKFCARSDPDAKLVWKKGSRTMKGNEKKYTYWNSTKTRLFSPAGGIQELQEKLFECFEYALKPFDVNVIDGLLFRRKVMKQEYSRWVKRILADENSMMRYVEDKLNELYFAEKAFAPISIGEQKNILSEPDYYRRADPIHLRTNGMNLILEVYEKYKKVFKDGKYTDPEGVEHLIERDRCDRTHTAIQALKKLFDDDINSLQLDLAFNK